MYSLTDATDLLIKSEKLWNPKNIESIRKYNSHKVRHTIWVLEVWRNIIIKYKENNEISDDLVNKSEICFILHDVWRLYQNNTDRILSNEEFDHWDKSAEKTDENWYSKSIVLAIKYHNKYSIDWIFEELDYVSMSNEEKEETLFLTKILRDADKLQNMIYSVFDLKHLQSLDVYWEHLEKSDISEINLKSLIENKLINRINIKTIWDYVLSSLCFVFDLNFNESLDILKFYWYFDKIYKILESSPWVKKESLEIVKENIYNFKIK